MKKATIRSLLFIRAHRTTKFNWEAALLTPQWYASSWARCEEGATKSRTSPGQAPAAGQHRSTSTQELILRHKLQCSEHSNQPKVLRRPFPSLFRWCPYQRCLSRETGFITGLILPQNDRCIYHVLYWYSFKQFRVKFSSFGSDIIAAAEAAER